ncbi:XRE family transcriptional regulator [Streptomyces sp. RFCAC02]|uniref:helix-turn-helix domain-containing protein n=1 Tax=Streptomyces sp. RFCAC02 TaxID=2499143 RepID=UPI00143DE93A|nr:XRE family transcriptional regulator [Streptomyces sp. RFCAC02]
MNDRGAGGPPAECVRLAATLRELRAATGLSMAALAARTPYSKSSWERYLNGRTVPPRQAVEELCALAGAPPQRPLALWELAESAWSGRDARQARPAVARDAAPPARPRVPRAYAVGLACLSLIAAGTLLVLTRTGGDDGPEHAGAVVVPAGCRGDACTGRDPEELECSTAAQPPVTLGEQRLHGTVVKVRHSELCGTVWARVDRGAAGDRVEIAVPDAEAQRAVVADEFDAMASVSTPMAAVSADLLDRVEACLVRDGERSCFTVAPG